MIATPVFQGLCVTVISLFLIQIGRRVTAQSRNSLVDAVNGGLNYLISG